MPTTIHFSYDADFLETPVGPAPALVVTLANPSRPDYTIETIAYLDTGAQRTLFDGEFATALGMPLLGGDQVRFASTQGGAVKAREHSVEVRHPAFGALPIIAAFSEDKIARNLLGRDFFALIEFGLRQYEQRLFINPRA